MHLFDALIVVFQDDSLVHFLLFPISSQHLELHVFNLRPIHNPRIELLSLSTYYVVTVTADLCNDNADDLVSVTQYLISVARSLFQTKFLSP